MSVSSLALFEEDIRCIPLISYVNSPSPIMLVECSRIDNGRRVVRVTGEWSSSTRS